MFENVVEKYVAKSNCQVNLLPIAIKISEVIVNYRFVVHWGEQDDLVSFFKFSV